MTARSIALSLLFFVAINAHAAAAPAEAGFAPESLWLSKTELTEGDQVTLYTVVYDSSANAISGQVLFSVDGATIGSEDFSLAAGASEIRSVTWTAMAGSHTFTAAMTGVKDSSGTGVSVLNDESAKVSVSVAAPPPPPEAPVGSDAVAAATSIASGTAPVIGSIASAIASTTESIRNAGQAYFAAALASSTPVGQVLGTSTKRTSQLASAASPGLWAQAILAFDRAGYAVFSSQLWFYLLLAFVALVLFYILRAVFFRRK